MRTLANVAGGLVGTELAGECPEFLNNIARSYLCINRSQLGIELV